MPRATQSRGRHGQADEEKISAPEGGHTPVRTRAVCCWGLLCLLPWISGSKEEAPSITFCTIATTISILILLLQSNDAKSGYAVPSLNIDKFGYPMWASFASMYRAVVMFWYLYLLMPSSINEAFAMGRATMKDHIDRGGDGRPFAACSSLILAFILTDAIVPYIFGGVYLHKNALILLHHIVTGAVMLLGLTIHGNVTRISVLIPVFLQLSWLAYLVHNIFGFSSIYAVGVTLACCLQLACHAIEIDYVGVNGMTYFSWLFCALGVIVTYLHMNQMISILKHLAKETALKEKKNGKLNAKENGKPGKVHAVQKQESFFKTVLNFPVNVARQLVGFAGSKE